MIIKINKKMIESLNKVDLSELCITSSVKIKESNEENIIVETKKAEGNKCPVCWKINKNPCSRHN